MKRTIITLIISITTIALSAQIRGEGQLAIKKLKYSDITRVDINLYADVLIDATQKGVTITAEENIMEYIDAEIVDSRLSLSQKKWIEPSQEIKIVIGAPNLSHVEQGTHNTTKVIGLDREDFVATALVGGIELKGSITTLNANAETGKILAQNADIESVHANIWSWGEIHIGEVQSLTGKIAQSGKVIWAKAPQINKLKRKSDAGGDVSVTKSADDVQPVDTRYIEFKLKNNSLELGQYVVRGPKPDGSNFGYGFPMRPQQTRQKNWTIGTKVYRKNRLGGKELVLTITAEDEGKTVLLHQ